VLGDEFHLLDGPAREREALAGGQAWGAHDLDLHQFIADLAHAVDTLAAQANDAPKLSWQQLSRGRRPGR
jgi:hypothetical protein